MFGFSFLIDSTKVARLATPPLLAFLPSSGPKGSMWLCTSLVCKMVIFFTFAEAKDCKPKPPTIAVAAADCCINCLLFIWSI